MYVAQDMNAQIFVEEIKSTENNEINENNNLAQTLSDTQHYSAPR